jgi:hypothetical protein
MRAITSDHLTALTLAYEFERFLSGESHGALLFDALYGSVADEPIPRRLLAIVRQGDVETDVPTLCAAAAS